MLSRIIKVKGGFIRAVRISEDFFDDVLNKAKLESYFPNPSARDALYSISQGLHPTSTQRVHLVSGTYGSGKSHFGLVLANYVTRNSNSPELEMLFHRLREKEPEWAAEIYTIRNTDRPYLPVLLESYDLDGAEHALLKGLREALVDTRRAKLSEELLHTSYQSAVDKIEEWKSKKSEFYDELGQLLQKEGGTIDTIDNFKKELTSKMNEEAYRLFVKLHLEITLSPFDPLHGKKASEIYREMARLLAGEYGYQGIVIIWDQFNDHLEACSTGSLGREVSFLRDFAETVERSREDQVHLMLISHRLPHTYIRGRISKDGLDNWMTLEGRFHEHALQAIEEAEELIDYAITVLVEEEEWKTLERDIEGATFLIDSIVGLNLYPERDRGWILSTICKGAFPLHPLATYCLPRISNVVGQAERTMFIFLEEEIRKGGLAQFINNNEVWTKDGKPNLYTADKLFDFFEEAISNTPETRPIRGSYAEALGRVRDPRDILTKRVMKALALLLAIRTKPAIPFLSTSTNLALLLNIDENELRPLLDSLVRSAVLWIRANGEYDFASGRVVVDFDDEFKKVRDSMAWDYPLYELGRRHTPPEARAREYAKQYRADRRLKAEYVEPGDLDNLNSYYRNIEQHYTDGILLYLVAETPEEITSAREEAVNATHPQLVIAIPKTPLSLLDNLRNLKVLEELGSRSPYDARGTQERREWEDRYEAEKGKVDRAIDDWLKVSNLEWFRGGVTLDVTGKNESDIADLVMFEVFDKTPKVAHRAMANRSVQDDKAHRVELNTGILDIKKDQIEYVATGKGSAPATKTILVQTFEPQGMLSTKRKGNFDYYTLKEPVSGDMKEVWDLMKQYLMKPGEHLDLPSLIDDLQRPPFGLCPRVIELFLSAFLHFYRNHFTIQTRRTKYAPLEKREFTGDTIYEIVNNPDPQKVIVEYLEELPLEEDYLLVVNNVVSPQKAWESKLSPVDGVGELFVAWLQGLPQVTRQGTHFEKDCQKFLHTIGHVDEDADMRELLLKRLPSALGIDKDFQVWEQEDLESFELRFNNIVDLLSNYPPEVVRQGLSLFRQIFEVCGQTEVDIMEKIRHWYNEIPAAVKEHKFSGDAYHLMTHANIQSTHQFTERFMEALPRNMGLGEYLSWTDVDDALENYKRKLLAAKAEIEKVQVQITGKRAREVKLLSKKAERLTEAIRDLIKRAAVSRDEIVVALEKLLGEYRK